MIHKITVSVFIFFLTVGAFAQRLSGSPYSQFGIGEESALDNQLSSLAGGSLTARKSATYLNFVNPAALSGLKFTVFEITGAGKRITLSDDKATETLNTAGLSYIAIGFPVYHKLGAVLGLQPVSGSGYQISQDLYDDEDNLIESTVYTGSGGTNRFFAGLGYELYRGISIGAEGGYYFGNLENSIIDSRDQVYYSTHHRTVSYLSGYYLKTALHYEHTFAGSYYLDGGLSFKLSDRLHTDSEEYLYSAHIVGTNEFPHDTLINRTNIKDFIGRPGKWGLQLGGGKKYTWFAGISLSKQDAWTFPSSVIPDNHKVKYTDRYSVGIGGFWVPNYLSLTSYWKRVKYLFGVNYAKTGLDFNPGTTGGDFTPLNKFGISFGLGLPIGNKLSQINIGLGYESMGNDTGGLTGENYVHLRIGLKISEKWFNKNKID